MSPDDTADVEQLDDLAHELGDAGRLARIVSAHREQPDPVFATNLRDELTGVLSAPAAAGEAAPAQTLSSPGPAAATPVVPAPAVLAMLSSGPFPGARATTLPSVEPQVETPQVDTPQVDAPQVGAPPIAAPSGPRAASSQRPTRPFPSPHAASNRREVSHPFGQSPEWPPASTMALEPPPEGTTATTVPTPTAGVLDSADVDEASIEAFYKWAAKARAADRTTVAAQEATSSSRRKPPAPVKTVASESLPASEAPAAKDSLKLRKPKARVRVSVPHVPTKWVLVGVVACLVVAVGVYGASVLMAPDHGAATAQETTSATLIRAGVRTDLTSYQELQVDDEIQAGAGGHVNLAIDDSHVRLAAGADVKLLKIDRAHVVLDQLAGEVYYRVDVPAGGDYIVNTGSVEWVASGTAFDLTRSPRASATGDEVVGLAVVDRVDIQGAGIGTTLQLNEGMSATVELSPAGIADGPPVTGAISTEALTRAWIVNNANLDGQMELPMGVLVLEASPSPTTTATSIPTPSPSEVPSSSPSATPTVTASPSESPTVVPSASPTQASTPKPTPTRAPTPKPTTAGPVNLGGLGFAASGNNDGMYTFSWAPYSGGWDGNTEYRLVYVMGTSGNPSYPASNFWPGGLTTASDQTSFVLNAADLQEPGTTSYRMRLQAVRGATVLAQTATITVSIMAPA